MSHPAHPAQRYGKLQTARRHGGGLHHFSALSWKSNSKVLVVPLPQACCETLIKSSKPRLPSTFANKNGPSQKGAVESPRYTPYSHMHFLFPQDSNVVISQNIFVTYRLFICCVFTIIFKFCSLLNMQHVIIKFSFSKMVFSLELIIHLSYMLAPLLDSMANFYQS